MGSMSLYTSTRKIELTALAFPAVMRSVTGGWQVEADVDLATLTAAVNAAPDDQTPVRDANEADIKAKALQALTTNASFLAITNPTNAQTVTQVQRLTRECSGLIRLILRALDSTDGT
jgi:hypothetical protein